MGQKQILVIAPYDNSELMERYQTGGKPIVYLPSGRARSPIVNGGVKNEVYFISKIEHDNACFEGLELKLAEDLIDMIVRAFEKRTVVFYALIPQEMFDIFLIQAECANVEPGPASRTPEERFTILIQQYDEENDHVVDPSHLFKVKKYSHPNYSEWELAPNEGFAFKQRQNTAPPARKAQPLESKPFDLEATYVSLASGNTRTLDVLNEQQLQKLINRCLDERRFDLIPQIDTILQAKQKKAS